MPIRPKSVGNKKIIKPNVSGGSNFSVFVPHSYEVTLIHNFELNCQSNVAISTWNFIFNQIISWESVVWKMGRYS